MKRQSRGESLAAFERRLERLTQRVELSRHAIVWLCGLPGSGKTQFLQHFSGARSTLRGRALTRGRWLILDDPPPDVLRSAIAQCGGPTAKSRRRLLIASRPTAIDVDPLLTPRVYGQVDRLADADLFVTADDCCAGGGRLFAATGGWPVLVDAWCAERSLDIDRTFAEFLQREVLPLLPEAVVVALFGALSTPLPDTAVAHLFGQDLQPHPLLARSDDGLTVSSAWVREALAKLRARPQVLPRAVLDRLIHLYASFTDPERAILSLIDIGQFDSALEVYARAGGMFFGGRHGYQALERILERFGPDWERRAEALFLARNTLMVKAGKPREALLRLDSQYPGLPVDLRRLRLSHRPLALLARLDICVCMDEPPPLDIVRSWGRLEALLPADDAWPRGFLFNMMTLGFLQTDALVEAERLANEALAVYERAGSPYLVHYMRLHLCDVALRQSRLRDAVLHLSAAEDELRASNFAFNSEPAVLDCFRARIAYEEGRFAACPADIDPILEALTSGDSWPDLLSSLAGHFVFTAFWQKGLREALDRLDRLALTLSRRHGSVRDDGLALVRIRLHQMARRPMEAGLLLEEFDLARSSMRSPRVQVEESLIRLRQMILEQRPVAEAAQTAGELAERPGLTARYRVSIGILRAYLHHRAGEAGPARRNLGMALRGAESGNLLGVLVEEGQFLERLLPVFMATRGPGDTRLADFARRVSGVLRALPAGPQNAKARAGLSRQEHRILSYVSERYTNKEIARALILSESAVKFHLRNLFRKLNVSSRGAVLDAARQRGIVN
jgi:DNA-binding CsgD family transcriptional regulator